jgi:hypothetical protein
MKTILIALVLGTLLGCTHNENSPASAAEQSRAIVAAALAEMNYEGVPPPPPEPGEQPRAQSPRDVLVSSTSLCFAAKNVSKQADCTFMEAESFESDGLDSSVPRELRKELVRANAARQPIDLSGVPRVRVVNAADIRKLVGNRSWDAFYERYPQTAGWVEISLPALSADGSHALVYLEHRCDGLCGTGTLVYLERAPKGWVVVKQLGLWIS